MACRSQQRMPTPLLLLKTTSTHTTILFGPQKSRSRSRSSPGYSSAIGSTRRPTYFASILRNQPHALAVKILMKMRYTSSPAVLMLHKSGPPWGCTLQPLLTTCYNTKRFKASTPTYGHQSLSLYLGNFGIQETP